MRSFSPRDSFQGGTVPAAADMCTTMSPLFRCLVKEQPCIPQFLTVASSAPTLSWLYSALGGETNGSSGNLSHPPPSVCCLCCHSLPALNRIQELAVVGSGCEKSNSQHKLAGSSFLSASLPPNDMPQCAILHHSMAKLNRPQEWLAGEKWEDNLRTDMEACFGLANSQDFML